MAPGAGSSPRSLQAQTAAIRQQVEEEAAREKAAREKAAAGCGGFPWYSLSGLAAFVVLFGGGYYVAMHHSGAPRVVPPRAGGTAYTPGTASAAISGARGSGSASSTAASSSYDTAYTAPEDDTYSSRPSTRRSRHEQLSTEPGWADEEYTPSTGSSSRRRYVASSDTDSSASASKDYESKDYASTDYSSASDYSSSPKYEASSHTNSSAGSTDDYSSSSLRGSSSSSSSSASSASSADTYATAAPKYMNAECKMDMPLNFMCSGVISTALSAEQDRVESELMKRLPPEMGVTSIAVEYADGQLIVRPAVALDSKEEHATYGAHPRHKMVCTFKAIMESQNVRSKTDLLTEKSGGMCTADPGEATCTDGSDASSTGCSFGDAIVREPLY